MTYLLLITGFIVLVVGAELLVRGASRLAALAGLSPLIIGLTVVAYGTSMPEMAVSVRAGWQGSADIALGNVVGSNTFNILFILGISALTAPLAVSQQLVRLDVPIMIAVSLLCWVMGWDGSINRIEGLFLFTLVVAYTVFLILKGRRESAAKRKADKKINVDEVLPGHPEKQGALAAIFSVAAGLILLVLGARWLVDGAGELARALGVSELLIGVTLVAAGTSLPELATSVVATLRGQRDIAVGNVVGSNIFNILSVLGASAAVSGGVGISPEAQAFDIPVMLAATFFCFPVFFSGSRISRGEGFLFLAYYVIYVLLLIQREIREDSLASTSMVVAGFFLPMLIIGLISTLRRKKPAISS